MSTSTFNPELWMIQALELAQTSLEKSEVPVGCLFIYNDVVIARGHNTVNKFKNATRHAELNCIDQVVEQFSKDATNVFHDTIVVVTVEPCIMCADILLSLNVKCVYYGCANDRFGGSSTVYDVKQHYLNPCNIVGGVCEEKALDKLRNFYKGVNVNSPMTSLKRKKIAKLQAENG
ncbi:tRNA-specific adenosine deaminase 2 [Bemisia tabaci]|uniref:tRNA-specific adenosine deaminase 2 n=1 Tax=Bemisia tabaci TaxID=7038 RepID=UPI003B2872DD